MQYLKLVLIACFCLISACTFSPKSSSVQKSKLSDTPYEKSLNVDFLASDFFSGILKEEENELKAILLEALKNNHNLQKKMLDIQKSFTLYQQSRSSIFPSIDLGLNSRYSDTVSPKNQSTRQTQQTYTASLSSVWEIDLWGKIRAMMTSSALNTIITKEAFYNAQLSLMSQTALEWYELVRAQKLKTLSKLNYQIKNRSLQKTKKRFYLGNAKGSDIRIAQTALANAQATQSLAENNLQNVKRRLEVLLGRYPMAELTGKTELAGLAAFSFNEPIQNYIENRPDIRQTALNIKRAGLDVEIARKSLYPSLSLKGDLSISGLKINDLFDLDQWAGNLVASLIAPVFNGGRLKANIKQKQISYKQALLEYAQQVLIAAQEIEDNLENEKWLKYEEQAYQKAFKSALSAYKQVEQQYNEGLVTIFDLLSSQSQRIQAEQNLINIQTNRIKNRIKTKISLGGVFKIH